MEFLRQVMTMVLSLAYLKPAEAVRRNCQVEIANTVNGFYRYYEATNAMSEPSHQKYLDFSTPLRSALECINAGKTLASHHRLTQLEDQPCCRMMAERISSSYCNSKKTNTGNTNTVYDQNNGIYRRRHFVRNSS